jgi:3-(3-hydroxy-phenyl)propionate hydroxylase
MDQESFDVAIVGYGPVGAMTALQLADAGLRVVILERGTALLDIPRAVGLDGEAMRAFQRLGLAEDVETVVQPRRPDEEFCFTDSKRQKYFGMELPPLGPNGWRDLAFFDQPQLEELLRQKITERGEIEVRLGFEVSHIDQAEVRVTLRGQGPSGEVAIDAAYLIGCDGASSFVRGVIGSKWESLGYDHDWLVVDITMGPDADLPTTMMQVCDPERLTTYIPGRDPYRRWEFELVEGDVRDEMCQAENIERMLEPWISPEHYEIRRAAVYQFHAATATEWRSRRILIAGDAAHQTPPFLGQGVNSGFRDAVCLGWKLPLVLAGESDAALLDSYQAERGAHSRDLVDRAVGIGQLMETLAAREAGQPDPHTGAESRAAAPNGQVIPPIRGGTLIDEQIKDDSPVGRAFFQPHVRDAAGKITRLDTYLGKGFAIVGRSEDDLNMGAEAQRVFERLAAKTVALDQLEVVYGEVDPLLETHPAVVVRPDRLIFGVVDSSYDLDRLLGELNRKLSLKAD